ncbi:MAG: hypothetical protein ACO3JT_09915 [Candidatus Nanopelagicales bacterium]
MNYIFDTLPTIERFHELAGVAMRDKVRTGRIDPKFATLVENLALDIVNDQLVQSEYRVTALTVAAVMSEFSEE